MSKDFKSPEGGFGPSTQRQPLEGGKPAAGITNDSKGVRNPAGPGPGKPANGSRIR